MSKTSDKRNKGIDIRASSVASEGDIVGGDKTIQNIQNILVVGQFLDFANVEGIIPKTSETLDFASVSEAFEKAFGERLGSDLATATSITGEILRGFLAEMRPANPFEALPIREILARTPMYLVRRLDELKYWDAFSANGGAYLPKHEDYLSLESLSLLWNKTFNADKRFYLVSRWKKLLPWSFWRENASYFWEIERTPRGGTTAGSVWIAGFGNDEFRVFMAGLVLDLIRLTSTASADANFWQGLTDLLTTDKSGSQ